MLGAEGSTPAWASLLLLIDSLGAFLRMPPESLLFRSVGIIIACLDVRTCALATVWLMAWYRYALCVVFNSR